MKSIGSMQYELAEASRNYEEALRKAEDDYRRAVAEATDGLPPPDKKVIELVDDEDFRGDHVSRLLRSLPKLNIGKRGPKHCSRCGEPGHNARTCSAKGKRGSK